MKLVLSEQYFWHYVFAESSEDVSLEGHQVDGN